MVNFQVAAINQDYTPYLPLGDGDYRYNVWLIIDGCLYSMTGRFGFYRFYREGDGLIITFDPYAGVPTATFLADKPVWNGDYELLSDLGKSLVGYVSPATIEAQAATRARSVEALKAKVKKPVIVADTVAPEVPE